MSSRQWEWQKAEMAKGNCKRCAKPRGKDGNKQYCRPCADKIAEEARNRYHSRLTKKPAGA